MQSLRKKRYSWVSEVSRYLRGALILQWRLRAMWISVWPTKSGQKIAPLTQPNVLLAIPMLDKMKLIENQIFPKNLIKMRCLRFHTIYFINFASESIWLVWILFSCRISKHWNQDQIYSLPRRLGCILVSRYSSPCNEIDRLFLGCIVGFFRRLSMIVVPILEFGKIFRSNL